MSDQSTTHADAAGTSAGTGALAFVVGALVVVVGIMSWFSFVEGSRSNAGLTINIEGAAEATSGASGN